MDRLAQLRCLVLCYCGHQHEHSFFLDRWREFLDQVRNYVLVSTTLRSGIVIRQMSASEAKSTFGCGKRECRY